jgi:hypothetical protein
MAYGLPNAVLKKLISSGFYQEDRDSTKTLAIENYEIHLSQLILQQGKNLRCLLPEFNQIDYRFPHANINPTSTIGDPNEELGYFGRSVHPYEVLFVKTNRNLYSEEYLARLAYSMEIASGSSRPMALRELETDPSLGHTQEVEEARGVSSTRDSRWMLCSQESSHQFRIQALVPLHVDPTALA